MNSQCVVLPSCSSSNGDVEACADEHRRHVHLVACSGKGFTVAEARKKRFLEFGIVFECVQVVGKMEVGGCCPRPRAFLHLARPRQETRRGDVLARAETAAKARRARSSPARKRDAKAGSGGGRAATFAATNRENRGRRLATWLKRRFSLRFQREGRELAGKAGRSRPLPKAPLKGRALKARRGQLCRSVETASRLRRTGWSRNVRGTRRSRTAQTLVSGDARRARDVNGYAGSGRD